MDLEEVWKIQVWTDLDFSGKRYITGSGSGRLWWVQAEGQDVSTRPDI